MTLIDKSRFTNKMNFPLLRELFYETARDKKNVVYTLKNEDHEGYPSLYRLYMESDDPTEYSFAIEHLLSYEHWVSLSNCSWMKETVQKWRNELEVRARSRALATIIKASTGTSREAFQAAKYIAEGYGEGKKRGRPSKSEIKQAADQLVSDDKRISEDFSRLMN